MLNVTVYFCILYMCVRECGIRVQWAVNVGCSFLSTAFLLSADPHNWLKCGDNTGMIGSRGSRRD